MSVERFYLLKDGKREGPFDESYVRFLLENDELGFDDFCETADGEKMRLGDLYESAEEDEAASSDARPAAAAQGRKPRDGNSGASDDKSSPSAPGVLYVGHPSFIKFPLSWLLVAGGAVGGTLVGPHSLWGMLACFAVSLLAVIYIVLSRAARLYVVTPRRIEAIRGLVAKDSREIRVEDVRTINVRRSGLVGILGVGTVEFSSTGDAVDVSFGDIWGARRIKKLVRRLQDELENS